jgi:nicotinamidase-related amidase
MPMAGLDEMAVKVVNRLQVLNDWLDPNNTALLIVDMQEEFTHPESNVARWFARQHGTEDDLPPYDPSGPIAPGDPDRDEIPALRTLIENCRRIGVPVIWIPTRNTEATDALFWRTVELHSCYEGEWTEKISAGLEPAADERIVRKTRSSGFYKTDLEQILRDQGTRTVLVAGRATSGCVEITCRDAMARDFGVVLVADCCGPPGPQHESGVRTIATFVGFPASSSEVIEILDKRSRLGAQF